MARDCLHKSESKQVTSSYFYDMADSLDRLLAEVTALFWIWILLFYLNSYFFQVYRYAELFYFHILLITKLQVMWIKHN